MPKKKSKKKLFIGISIGIIVVIAFVFMFVFNKNNAKIDVITSKVEKRNITQTVTATGKIQPETEVKISPQTSGEIIELSVKEGDTVRDSKILVRIKPDIVETQLEQFRAAVDASTTEIDAQKAEKTRSETDLKRKTELLSKKYISQEEFDRAKAISEQANSGYQSSLARLQQSKAMLKQYERAAARTTIYSPMNGIVTKLNVEKGEKVVGTEMMQGTEMMRISDMNVMNAVVEVDENDITLVKRGDTALIKVDAFPEKIYKGYVIEIGHSALVNSLGTQDQVTNFEVKIRIIDKDAAFRPGMTCSADIQTQTKNNVLAIPLQSVTTREEKEENLTKPEDDQKDKKDKKVKLPEKPQQKVFIKDGDKVKTAKVKTGLSDSGFIEILEGLNEGDEVISGSYMAISKLLHDGAFIRIDTNMNKRKLNKDSKD